MIVLLQRNYVGQAQIAFGILEEGKKGGSELERKNEIKYRK